MKSHAIPQRQALTMQLAMIAGGGDGWGDQLIEIRYKRGRGMGQRFMPARDRDAIIAAISELAPSTDVYIGAAPRTRQAGGADAVEQVNCLWADCDCREAVAALERSAPAPSLIVRSGSGENRHAYWQLRRSLSPGDARRANRRLAHALGADSAATDPARILRPAGTLNWKHEPPAPVECVALDVAAYDAAAVVGELPDPPKAEQERPARVRELPRGDDALARIPAREYVPILTGRELTSDGKVCCPFHDDRTPSLHAYTDDRGWACFACPPAPWQRSGAQHLGGGIIDLGAMLYGIEPRGSGYFRIRERLASDLLAAIEGAA